MLEVVTNKCDGGKDGGGWCMRVIVEDVKMMDSGGSGCLMMNGIVMADEPNVL